MNKFVKRSCSVAFTAACLLFAGYGAVFAAQPQPNLALTNFDVRLAHPPPSSNFTAAIGRLHARVPDVQVRFDKIIGSPAWITSPHGFLTGPNGVGRAVSP